MREVTALYYVAGAATADPHAEQQLLDRAAVDGVKGLRDECARVKAAARTDEVAHHQRIREQRSLRSFSDRDGAGRIEIRGPVEDTARVMSALEPFEREQFELARASGERERADTIAFDALVAMATAKSASGELRDDDCDASSAGEGGSDHRSSASASVGGGCRTATTVGATVNVRVDHSALLRGHTVPGEVCEIPGVGPIPVAVARQLLDDCLLRVLVVDGNDVLAVSSARRTIPSRLRAALEERQPECGLEGCNVHRHLEIDHNVPLEAGGLTELANLNRLCRFHHRHKHEHDLRLEGSGTAMRFVTPDRGPPPSPPP